ncbi:MAG: hypothetical protein WAO76_05425 [Georgfuchsia sp.]
MKELMGLAVLAWPLTLMVAFVLAFALAVAGTYQATRKQKSGWKWSLGVAIVLYLAVFWDHIPTIIAHKYYCESEAGFWVYKTVDQWKAENPGVMETLIYNNDMPHIQTPHGGATALNQRIIYQFKYEGPFLFNRWRMQSELRDRKTGELIAREVNFSTSQERRQAGWSGWKFWLDSRGCKTESHRDQGAFDKVTAQFEGAKK